MATKEELFEKLALSIVEMEEDDAIALANEVIENGYDALEAIEQGLSEGMHRASKLYGEEEYFIPELLLCSEAMYAGIEVLKPHIKAVEGSVKPKVVIGVIEGDTHDIGKNLVKIMFETSGFEVTDLGRDVSPEKFVDTAIESNADIIAMSTLMTTTMSGMETVVNMLNSRGVRDKFKVMIGGGPVSKGYAAKIGADSYTANSTEAVISARELVG